MSGEITAWWMFAGSYNTLLASILMLGKVLSRAQVERFLTATLPGHTSEAV